ncbi:MAG: hypothetical protein PHG68_07175 [Candidatus Omnitrophica bacterium]|nr:hypothetical protein [Candidatus Omnitrophota bacterium]
MEKKGLCLTCEEVKSCIYSKEPTVVFCEEFSPGAAKLTAAAAAASNRVIRQETTEIE